MVTGMATGAAGMGAQRATGGCACLMNHHILPTIEHTALQVRAHKNLKDFTAKLAYVF